MTGTISVGEFNRYVNGLLERDPTLNPVRVVGEISGFKAYPSGHFYFTLKDSEAAVACVFFKGYNQHLKFRPENGRQVVLTGRAAVYDKDGRFQLIVLGMELAGIGDLHLAFEQLKSKLEKEGLFAASCKQPLPMLPRVIGVATSPAGAVIRDIIQVLSRRFANFRLQLIPVPVQGTGAAAAIARAIELFNRLGQADVLIVGRGGGSLEDLWAFNEEVVARAVAASRIPVISAVGHETDFTICDWVADIRAPTPSAAAELVMPLRSDLEARLRQNRERLAAALWRQLDIRRRYLALLLDRPVLSRPREPLDRRRMDLDRLTTGLRRAATSRISEAGGRLALLSGKLDTLSPLKTLSRGFAAVFDRQGQPVVSIEKVSAEEPIAVQLQDGRLECRIIEITPGRIE